MKKDEKKAVSPSLIFTILSTLLTAAKWIYDTFINKPVAVVKKLIKGDK